MKKTIRTIKLDRLTNGAFQTLCKLISTQIDELDDASFLFFVSGFKQTFDRFDQLMKQIYASALSSQLATLDAIRDRDYRFFRIFINYTLKSRNTEAAISAKYLDVIFRNYGDVPRMSYPDETANIGNIVGDMRREGTFVHVKAIPFAEEYLDLIEEHNNNFIELYEQRTDEKFSIITGGTFKARKALTASLRTLLNALEAKLLLGGTAKEKEIALKIDKLFEQANQEMARRGNGVPRKKGEGEDGDDNNNGPIEIKDMTTEEFSLEDDFHEIAEEEHDDNAKQ
jgi:hypothetical protein